MAKTQKFKLGSQSERPSWRNVKLGVLCMIQEPIARSLTSSAPDRRSKAAKVIQGILHPQL